MKKIGVFSDDFYPYIGGMGKHIHQLYEKMPNGKYCVFSTRKNTLPNHIQLEVPLREKLKAIAVSLWLAPKLNNLIKEHKLEVLNIHSGPGGLFLLKKPKVKTVITIHHTYWQQYHYVKSDKWKKIFVPFEKRNLKLADKIICVSEDTQRVVVEEYNIPKEKTIVIPNGVDIERFKPLKNLPLIPKSVLYIGRIDARKGVDFLLRSFVKVLETEKKAKLYIGGKGKDLEAMKAFVKEKGISSSVEFLGYVDDGDFVPWYNKASCVVVPSVFEGFGIAALEPMLCGAHVIATDVDGLRCVVKDGYNGKLVSYGDEEVLSKKILEAFETEGKKLSSKVRKELKAKYDWEVIADETRKALGD